MFFGLDRSYSPDRKAFWGDLTHIKHDIPVNIPTKAFCPPIWFGRIDSVRWKLAREANGGGGGLDYKSAGDPPFLVQNE